MTLTLILTLTLTWVDDQPVEKRSGKHCLPAPSRRDPCYIIRDEHFDESTDLMTVRMVQGRSLMNTEYTQKLRM